MERKLIAHAGSGSGSFFEKLRSGFTAVQNEVAKVEQLTDDQAQAEELHHFDDKKKEPHQETTTSTAYFEADIKLLRDMYSVYVSWLLLQKPLQKVLTIIHFTFFSCLSLSRKKP